MTYLGNALAKIESLNHLKLNFQLNLIHINEDNIKNLMEQLE